MPNSDRIDQTDDRTRRGNVPGFEPVIPLEPPSPKMRTWPPRPETALLMTANLVLDPSLSETLKDDPVKMRRPPISEPAESAFPADDTVKSNCPHCQLKLIDPEGIGMCPKCGYCRSTAIGGTAEMSAPWNGNKTNPSAARSRAWVWATVIGAVAIVIMAVVANRKLPETGHFHKYWSTAQLGCGVVLMLAAQWWACVKLAAENVHIGVLDLFVPSGRIWTRVFGQTSAMRGPVWLGCWGLVLVVTAIAIIGGLGEWLATPNAGGVIK